MRTSVAEREDVAVPAILLIGDAGAGSGNLRAVETALLRETGAERLRRAADIGAVRDGCSPSGPAFDLIVVCQHWPDEFCRADVAWLLTAFPTARLVCCYGAWCASDGRTRDTWPIAVRVPIEAFSDRLQHELQVIAGEAGPLPPTAARDEVFAFDHASGGRQNEDAARGSGQLRSCDVARRGP
jgi:hypothetical protein